MRILEDPRRVGVESCRVSKEFLKIGDPNIDPEYFGWILDMNPDALQSEGDRSRTSTPDSNLLQGSPGENTDPAQKPQTAT